MPTTLPFFHLVDFTARETYHAARFEKDTRYYVMRLEKDLLDDWVVVVINGRLKSKLGQCRTLALTGYNDAFDKFSEMANTRYRRGYHCTAYQNDAPIFTHLLAIFTRSAPITIAPKQRGLNPQKEITPLTTRLPASNSHQQLTFGF